MQHNVRLIASSPNMLDPIFKESLILLLENDEYGAFGFILNKPRDLSLSEVLLDEKPLGPKIYHAWFGGPVDEQRGFLLCNSSRLKSLGIDWNESDEDQLNIRDGIITTANPMITEEIIWQHFDLLSPLEQSKLSTNSDLPFRFILGYSGWNAEQLEKEISEGWWLEIPWNKDLIFKSEPSKVWSEALSHLGIKSLAQYMATSTDFIQ
jgi:putative transcriptional regulator